MPNEYHGAQDGYGTTMFVQSQLKTLVVGDVKRWLRLGNSLPDVEGLQFVSLDELTTSLLASFQPDLVLSPLMQQDYDAAEIARKLNDLGFRGRYRAISDAVPDKQLVARDIATIAPDVDFDIIDLPQTQDER